MTGMVFSRVGCDKLRVNIACDKPCVGVEISLFRDFSRHREKILRFCTDHVFAWIHMTYIIHTYSHPTDRAKDTPRNSSHVASHSRILRQPGQGVSYHIKSTNSSLPSLSVELQTPVCNMDRLAFHATRPLAALQAFKSPPIPAGLTKDPRRRRRCRPRCRACSIVRQGRRVYECLHFLQRRQSRHSIEVVFLISRASSWLKG